MGSEATEQAYAEYTYTCYHEVLLGQSISESINWPKKDNAEKENAEFLCPKKATSFWRHDGCSSSLIPDQSKFAPHQVRFKSSQMDKAQIADEIQHPTSRDMGSKNTSLYSELEWQGTGEMTGPGNQNDFEIV
ncbi:hypothetical protein M378DRAFT_373039 [Amanita muscaria Koide BX008]|uniref:Uncharacterized protein n=1 Tax=Amanita muscaria (strain Koide BX008) TaxID=946122 RepID=A0A0C2XBC8_AMAMK|nr:hypothetical protein M378DRAFT_373039 [Amanita muscaria Koide BX008]